MPHPPCAPRLVYLNVAQAGPPLASVLDAARAAAADGSIAAVPRAEFAARVQAAADEMMGSTDGPDATDSQRRDTAELLLAKSFHFGDPSRPAARPTASATLCTDGTRRVLALAHSADKGRPWPATPPAFFVPAP